jgi:hypothetical protein
MVHALTTGKTTFCPGSKPSVVSGIELVQSIRYKYGRSFVPREIPGTNATHLYRAEPRPDTNVPSTRRRGRGALVLGGGTTRYKCFFFFCFMIFFTLTYLLKVLILIVRHLSVRNVVPTLTSSKRQGLSLNGQC